MSMYNARTLSAAALMGAAALFSACNKEDESTKPGGGNNEPQRWMTVYRDIIIGDDSTAAEGQFLDTRTGTVHKMAAVPDSLRKHLSLCYYVTQTGSYEFITSAGSLQSLPTGAVSSRIATAPGYGVNNWSAADKNTLEIRQAAYGSEEMTTQEFETVAAAKNWDNFNTAFKENNGGDENLSFTSSYAGAGGGEIYLAEINNALRCIIYVKAASSDPVAGFVRMDILVEGRTDAPSGAAALMPPKP